MAVKINDNKETRQIEVVADEYTVAIDMSSLKVDVKSGEIDYEFLLGGNVNYRPAGDIDGDPIGDVSYKVAAYRSEGKSIKIDTAPDRSHTINKSITLDFAPDHFTYALTITPMVDIALQDVKYGGQVNEIGKECKSAATFDEFYIWCPDRYQSIIPFNQTTEIKLSTRRIPYEDGSFFRGDVGKYIAPPYIVALSTGERWTGLAVMDIPQSEFGEHLQVTRQDYVFDFRYANNKIVPAGKEMCLPQIGFFFADQRDDVLKKYVAAIFESGLAIKPKTWADWWAGPIYCSYADQVYHHIITSGIRKDESGATVYCNEDFLAERLQIMDDHTIPYCIIILDYGWLDRLGDYNPDIDHFADLRDYIDRMHEAGKHVLLWFAPFFCESESDLAKAHPNWMVKNLDGSINEHIWMKKRVFTPDFTNPAVRDHFKSMIHRLLSPDVGGLNADGFKIDGYSFLPGVDQIYYDPTWGTGDLLQFQASKFIYDVAKNTKPDALIENSIANPLFNNTQDLCRLNDASNYDTDLYENRAWVALLSGAAVPDTDDWSAFQKMFVHSTLRKAVYGIPAFYAIKYRGTGRMGGASGGYPVPISEEDYRRVSAILRVYMHAPVDPTQERFIDPDMKIFWRKYTTGELAGFYSATTLAGNTAIATYTPESVHLAAIIETQVAVPIPPGYTIKYVREIKSDGSRITPHYHMFEESVLLWMQASTTEVDHYEIEFGTKPDKYILSGSDGGQL